MKSIISNLLFRTYYLTIMCYIERDKYFDILCNESEEECQNIASKILSNYKTL